MQTLGGFKDAIIDAGRAIAKSGAEAMGKLLKAIADLTYWNPHPPIDSPSELFMIPDDWGIWLTLWDYHMKIAVPVCVCLLVFVWFARQAGVATNILGAQERVQSNRSLISGIFAVFLSFHGVVIYLNITQLIVTAIAPGADPLSDIALRFAGVGGAAALIIVFLNVSINATLILLLFLINAARIFATFMLPILVPYAVALRFGRVPLLTDQVVKITKLLATSPLWTIPVAAGWRMMTILGGEGDGQTIGQYIIAEAGLNGIPGGGLAEQLITSSLFMVPVIIGILAPLKMSGAASSMFYMSRLGGMSIGKDASGGDDGGDGEDGEDGGMGGEEGGEGEGGEPGEGGSGIPSASGSGGGSGSGGSGGGPSGGGSASNVNSASAGTDDSLFEDAVDAFNPIDGDKEYIDREKANVTARAGKAGIGLAEDVTEETIDAGKMAAGSARDSVSDFLSEGGEPAGPEGFDPDGEVENPEGPENDPAMNAAERGPDVGGGPGVPTEENQGSDGVDDLFDSSDDYSKPSSGGDDPLGDLFGGGTDHSQSKAGPNGSTPESGQISDMFDQSGGSAGPSGDTPESGEISDMFDESGGSGGSVSGAVGDIFGVNNSESGSGVDPGEFIDRGQPAESDDINLGENEEFDDSAGRWQDYSPASSGDARSPDSVGWLDEDDSLATQLEKED